MGQDGVDNVQWEGRTSRRNDRGTGGGQPSPIIAVLIFFLYSPSESLHASENNLEVMLPETIMSDVAPPVPDWSLIGSHPT